MGWMIWRTRSTSRWPWGEGESGRLSGDDPEY
jgi:hypothetical protein